MSISLVFHLFWDLLWITLRLNFASLLAISSLMRLFCFPGLFGSDSFIWTKGFISSLLFSSSSEETASSMLSEIVLDFWYVNARLSTLTTKFSTVPKMFLLSSFFLVSNDCYKSGLTSKTISIVFFCRNAFETVDIYYLQEGQSKFFLNHSDRQPPQAVCKHGAIWTGSCISWQQIQHSCSPASL